MKVKAIKDYNDLQLKRIVKQGEIIPDVTEERAKALVNAKVAEVIEDEKPVETATSDINAETATAEPTPKKKPGRKKGA